VGVREHGKKFWEHNLLTFFAPLKRPAEEGADGDRDVYTCGDKEVYTTRTAKQKVFGSGSALRPVLVVASLHRPLVDEECW